MVPACLMQPLGYTVVVYSCYLIKSSWLVKGQYMIPARTIEIRNSCDGVQCCHEMIQW